jgi:hypothetical protein
VRNVTRFGKKSAAERSSFVDIVVGIPRGIRFQSPGP